MDPKLMLIACALAGGLLPFERMLFAPEGDPVGGGGGGGNAPPAAGAGDKPADKPPAKTYDDAQVNALIAKERRSIEEKAEKSIAETKAAFEKQLAELNEKLELAGKSADEQKKLLAEKAQRQLETERAALAKTAEEATAKAAALAAKHERTVKRHIAQSALAEAKALPRALGKAVEAFLADVEIDIDPNDETKVTGVRLDGVAHKSVAEAAVAFLRTNDWFASAPPGGTGTKPGTAMGTGDWKSKSPEDLMADALRNG